MSDIPKKYVYKGLPGFDRDPETGRYFPVPVNFKAVFGSDDETSRAPRNLKDGPSSVQKQYKVRKPFYGVRKELYKVPSVTEQPPPKKFNPSKPPLAKGSLGKKSFSIQKRFDKSPSTEDDCEFARLPPTPRQQECNKTADFEQLEQLCKTPKISSSVEESPVTKVSNLLESSLLLDEAAKPNSANIIAEIRKIAALNQELFDEASTKLREATQKLGEYEENSKLINSLIDKLDTQEEKENVSRRRSLRLQKKDSGKQLGSPRILKSGDLRKSALTKSLVHKCQKYQMDSPRTQKALDMYNSTKKGCKFVLTPTKGSLIESPLSSKTRSNLSASIREQCYLLQDTPCAKKMKL